MFLPHRTTGELTTLVSWRCGETYKNYKTQIISSFRFSYHNILSSLNRTCQKELHNFFYTGLQVLSTVEDIPYQPTEELAL